MVQNNLGVSPSQGLISELGLKNTISNQDTILNLDFKSDFKKVLDVKSKKPEEDKNLDKDFSLRGNKKKAKKSMPETSQMQMANSLENSNKNFEIMDFDKGDSQFSDLDSDLISQTSLADENNHLDNSNLNIANSMMNPNYSEKDFLKSGNNIEKLDSKVEISPKLNSILEENFNSSNILDFNSLSEETNVSDLSNSLMNSENAEDFKYLSSIDKQILSELDNNSNLLGETDSQTKIEEASVNDFLSTSPESFNKLDISKTAKSVDEKSNLMGESNKNEIMSDFQKRIFEKLQNEKLNDSIKSVNDMTSSSLAQPISKTASSNFNNSSFNGQSTFKNSDSFLKSNEDSGTTKLDSNINSELHVGQTLTKEFSLVNKGNSLQSMNGLQKSAVESEENLNQIVQKADFLVKEGGGEAIVKMTPEGMGQVHLKLQVENGKINLELQSEDKNVKKMIEDSLNDLKSQLSHHQIQINHVKVNDVASSSSNQFYQDSANKENGSNSYFNNSSDSFAKQQGSFSSGQERSYNRQTNQNGLAMNLKSPIKASLNKHVSNPYLSTNKGQSVNMVA